MMNKKKKNFTILFIAVLNFILTVAAIIKLKSMVPINVFEKDIGKMCSKQLLLGIPTLVIILSLLQVLFRLKTMEKKVTTGKIIEDALFAFVDGLLICINWLLVYIGVKYTETTLININIPVIYIVMGVVGLVLCGIYSTFPINKKGALIGLKTKETLEDDEVWRIANRFNGFTGFVAALIIILLSAYYIVNGFNIIYFIFELFVCGMLMFYIPVLNARMVARKKSERIIE
jgi:hypothetical protein